MKASARSARSVVLLTALATVACQGEPPASRASAAPRATSAQAAPVWMPVGAMSTSRQGHTATLLPSGLVLVAGGLDGAGSSVETAELYDPSTGTWRATSSMAIARFAHTATLLPGGKVLVAGGSPDGRAELYDAATGTWSLTGATNVARSFHTATAIGSTVLLAGGETPDGITATAELYDLVTGAWTQVGSLARERWGHSATLLRSGHVLVAGGRSLGGDLVSSEIYDPTTRAFAPTGSMAQPRKLHAAALLPSGRVLVAGGYDVLAGVVSGCELFDEASGSWRFAGDLGLARYESAAVVVVSGTVLLAGGGAPDGDTATAELFDPATAAWASTATMTAARRWHTLTVLPSGSVLAAGGGAASAEVLDLVDGTSALTIWPLTAEVRPGGAIAFTASGGSGTGYAWSLSTNGSGGRIDAETGAYVAGSRGSSLDVVQVTDSRGNTATRPVVVTEPPPPQPPGPALAASPAGPLPPRGTAQLSATGGSGAGYAWSFETNASGGSLSGAVYQAGPRGEVVDVVTVADSEGNRATLAITITAGVTITVHGGALVQPEDRRGLTASGGSGAGYRWSLLSNASLGAVDPSTGAYVAGPVGGGSDLVQVIDSLGNVATASVSVMAWRLEGSGGCGSTGGDGAPALVLLLGAAAVLRGSRRPRRATALMASLLLGATSASAQGFESERLQPNAGARDLLGVQSALVAPHLARSAAAYVSYAERPLQLAAGTRQTPVLNSQTTLTAGAALGLLDRFELSLAVPFSVQQVASVGTYAPGLGSLSGSALGDLRASGKAQLYSASGLTAAVALPVTFPTGDTASYLGQGGVTASPRVIVEYALAPGWRVVGNAGVALRSASRQLDLQVGNAVTYALGAEAPFRLAGQRLSAVATLGGETQLNSHGGDPGLEALAGVTWHGPLGLAVTVGGGPGLTHGYGVPSYRFLTALAFGPGSGRATVRPDPLGSAAPRPQDPAENAAPAPRPEAPVVTAAVEPAPPSGPALEVPRRFGTVHFAFDSARVPADATTLLDAIARELRGDLALTLRVEGHADRRGPATYNQVLSERRARAVRDALVQRGVDRERVTVAGFGPTRPADPAHTRAAYAKNRRVDVIAPPKASSNAIAAVGSTP